MPDLTAFDFEDAIDAAACDVIGALGNNGDRVKKYVRKNGQVLEPITALRRTNIELFSEETASVVAYDVVYDLVTTEVGEVVRGDVIIDGKLRNFVQKVIEDNGSSLTVFVRNDHGRQPTTANS